MAHILALDQGTTSSRAIVFDRTGSVMASAQEEFRQIFPQPGWVEHDPLDIWRSQREVALAAVKGSRLSSRQIAAIGITNQRETTLIWDRATGRPVYNAIVWQDRRTAAFCDGLRQAGHEPLFRQKTGLVLDAYFSGTKIRWILDHVPTARARAERGELAFGTVDSWLLWKLTGVHATDPSNASRTLLYNIAEGRWDDELLGLVGVPRAVLPEVRSSSEVYGTTDLLEGTTPIAGIAGDQQAALFGQACASAGMAKNTYGTGCFMLMNTGSSPAASANNLLSTVAWQTGTGRAYALEGSIFVAGAVVQWLRDKLGIIADSSEVEELARSEPDNGGVYFVPAFVGLGAPHWDSYARGTITGLTRGSTAGHIARAALESIAYQSADVIEAMESDSGTRLQQLRVDGGATANNLLMQFQADLLGVPVVRPKVRETTALGAAYLAGLAVGYWESAEEIGGLWQIDRTFEPGMSADHAHSLRTRWNKALSRAKAWEEN